MRGRGGLPSRRLDHLVWVFAGMEGGAMHQRSSNKKCQTIIEGTELRRTHTANRSTVLFNVRGWLPFNVPNNWTDLTDDDRKRLRQKHAKEAHKHEIRMHTHWMTLAQDRGSWRTMIRGPEPETTRGGSAVRRARAQRSNHRHQHQHQPVHFQPAVAPHNYQQHAGNFNDMEGYVVHRNFDD